MSKSTARVSKLVKNVAITPELTSHVRFVRKTNRLGEPLVWVKARKVEKNNKFIIIQESAKSAIGFLPGQRANPKVTAASPRAVYLKMVELLWTKTGKAGKSAAKSKQEWFPEAA